MNVILGSGGKIYSYFVTMVIVAAKDRIPKNMTKSRTRVRELSTAAYANGDYTGWFETLYAEA
ncbi:hypothetical protein, partial [Chamaesiphon sp. OTE_20_metabat_361]|uniref:hypothetical protein n=1 Tax=Chamaesiphon sp. OTE_20_metabat_361 TaxID=2964689 RepID=UPI00286A57D3